MSSTNVSSLRLKILGDGSGLEAALSQGSKRIAAFAEQAKASGKSLADFGKAFGSGDFLSRDLSKARSELTALAQAFAVGGRVGNEQISAAAAKVRELEAASERAGAVMRAALGQGPGLRELKGAAFYREGSFRSLDEQLSGVRARMALVAAEYARTGREGGHQLDRLARLEAALTARIEQRAAILNTARAALKAEGDEAVRTAVKVAAVHGGGFGPGNMVATSAAFGLQDALSAYQFGGGKAAAIAASNNLPILGMGIGQVASQFATGAGTAARFASVLARFAGPAGLVASIALPMGALLIPKLFETEKAAKKTKRAFDEFAESFAAFDRLAEFRRLMEVEVPKAAKAFGKGTGEELRQQLEDSRNRLKELDIERTAGRQKIEKMLVGLGVKPEFARTVQMPAEHRRVPALDALRNAGLTPGFEALERLKRLSEDLLSNVVKVQGEWERVRAVEAQIGKADLKDFHKLFGEREQQAAEAKRDLRGLATDILGDFNPGAARRERAQQALDDRLAQIDELLPGFGNTGRRLALGDAARAAFRAELAGEPRGLAPAAQYGSVEAVSALNRAIYSSRNDKDAAETAKNTAAMLRELQALRQDAKNRKVEQFVAGPAIP